MDPQLEGVGLRPEDVLHGAQKQWRGDELLQVLVFDRGVLHGEQQFGSGQEYLRGHWERGRGVQRARRELFRGPSQVAPPRGSDFTPSRDSYRTGL